LIQIILIPRSAAPQGVPVAARGRNDGSIKMVRHTRRPVWIGAPEVSTIAARFIFSRGGNQ
jgi:hypothetical protein